MRNLTFLATLLALPVALAAPLHAQERTVQHNLQAEASWTALSNLVKAADMKAETAQIMATAAKDCGVDGKLYGPGTPTSDPATGCKPIVDEALTATVNHIIECSKKRQFYNGRKCLKNPASHAADTGNPINSADNSAHGDAGAAGN